MTIGFIGAGTMGKGMILNLAKKGEKVIVYNRTRRAAEELKSENISVANGFRDIAKADIIMVCVSNDKSLEDVLFKGLFHENIKGKILIDSSTTSPEMTLKISEEAKKKGFEFMDAPVTGGKQGADNGQLVFMVGGDKKIFEKCKPTLDKMAKICIHCGPITYGQRAKISLNLMQSLILESTLEGLILARKNGVSLETMELILENSGAKSGIGTGKLALIKSRDFTQTFKQELMHKDVRLADSERKKLGLHLPLTEAILEVFDRAAVRSQEDFATIVKDLEKAAGIELK